MKKIKVLQLGIAAILLLCAVFCQGQSKNDTVKVVLLVCDTSIKITGNDYGLFPNPVGWKFGYEIKSCFYGCCDPEEKQLAKYYWNCTHVEYLDDKKKPLPKNVIVWQSVSAK
jgi:hypothetical protein